MHKKMSDEEELVARVPFVVSPTASDYNDSRYSSSDEEEEDDEPPDVSVRSNGVSRRITRRPDEPSSPVYDNYDHDGDFNLTEAMAGEHLGLAEENALLARQLALLQQQLGMPHWAELIELSLRLIDATRARIRLLRRS
jgi:hypothetical protein